jgi:hypothetical protein
VRAKNYYRKNRKKIRERQQRWRENKNVEYLAMKQSPCADCRMTFIPWVMEFDHIDPDNKISDVSRLRVAPTELLLEEIAKCDVVCANCHRIREYNRWLSRQAIL